MSLKYPFLLKSTIGLLGLFSNILLYAVSAYPGIIEYCCSDGSYVNLRLKGDESCKWALTEDGYTLLCDSLGEWCYAFINQQGETDVSGWKLSAVRSKEVTEFLKKIPKQLNVQRKNIHLKSSVNRQTSLLEPVTGKLKTLVVLMQYKDQKIDKSQADFNSLFNQLNYKEDGARGSIKDFFRENSYDQLDLTCDIIGPFTSSRNMSYYGGNNRNGQDEHPTDLFLEALNFVSSRVNLTDYDMDHDGYINNIHIIFAGYGEEAGGPADAIWSHEALFAEPLEINNLKITGYSCAPELRGNRGNGISRIGVHCHEIGHSFGALDYYDTDYEINGEYSGTGKWDLMASGSWNNEGVSPAHFNPYVKTTFGWTNCEILQEDENNVILPATLKTNQIYRINTDVEGDYFLLENRQKVGFDEAIPGGGLMIYHILPQIVERSVKNTINATFPQTCYPVCASSAFSVPNKNPASYGNIDSSLCPFPGELTSAEFTPWSVPAALSSEGGVANIRLKDICRKEDGNISFNVIKENTLNDQFLIFSESFEKNNLTWSWEQLKGRVQWEIYKPNLLVTTMPIAAEGIQYLMMQMEWKNMPLAISRIISPIIKRTKKGEKYLSFKYQNRTSLLKQGHLKILYRQAGQTDWQYLATLSDMNNNWKEYRMDLPADETDFQIAFEGEMEAGLILIDDVKVYSYVATTICSVPVKPISLICHGMQGKVCVESDKSARIRIYNLIGKVVYFGTLREGMNTIELDPGLYIGVCEKAVAKFYVY